jgi:hypothetical protein
VAHDKYRRLPWLDVTAQIHACRSLDGSSRRGCRLQDNFLDAGVIGNEVRGQRGQGGRSRAHSSPRSTIARNSPSWRIEPKWHRWISLNYETPTPNADFQNEVIHVLMTSLAVEQSRNPMRKSLNENNTSGQ